eukprot:746605-Hanusia_phi.AAC.1
MFVCGFAPVRFRRLPSGDVVPECLPLGSFRWSVETNKLKKDSELNKDNSRKGGGNKDGNAEQAPETDGERGNRRYIPRFIPKYEDEGKTLRYKIQVLTGNITEEEVMIYEFVQPNFNISSNSRFYATVNSPMAGLIHEYKDLREARTRRSMADAWNTRAHVVCTLKDTKIPTDQPRENFLATQLTLPSVWEEHQRFLASINNQEYADSKKIMSPAHGRQCALNFTGPGSDSADRTPRTEPGPTGLAVTAGRQAIGLDSETVAARYRVT